MVLLLLCIRVVALSLKRLLGGLLEKMTFNLSSSKEKFATNSPLRCIYLFMWLNVFRWPVTLWGHLSNLATMYDKWMFFFVHISLNKLLNHKLLRPVRRYRGYLLLWFKCDKTNKIKTNISCISQFTLLLFL